MRAVTQRASKLVFRFGLEVREGLLHRPGVAVDAGRHEGVVHVADCEDPRREVEVVGFQATGIAAAVEALVVVEHEARDALVEAAELLEQLAAALGMRLDDGELVVVERPGLLQDRVGDGELADVVQKTADRHASEACAREAHLLADLDSEHGDAACVLLRGRVLRPERDHERPDARTEERLLRRDDLARAQIAHERTRASAAVKVVRQRSSDERDAEHLEHVPEPPTEIHECQDERAVGGRCEEHQPEDDRQVGEPAGEQERVRGADGEPPVENEGDGEQEERGRRARRGNRRDDARDEHADEAHRDDRHCDGSLDGEHPWDGRRRGERREH